MQQFEGFSLKTRLYLLVLAAFLPVAVLIVYIAEELKDIQRDAILQRTMVMARSAADEENQQLEATRVLLTAVAGAPWIAIRMISRSCGRTIMEHAVESRQGLLPPRHHGQPGDA